MHNAADNTGSSVNFGSQDHRNFPRQHVADNTAADPGDHPHADCYQRTGVGRKGFIDPDADKHRQPNGVQHRQDPLGQAARLAYQQQRQHAGDHGDHQVGRIFHPEYRPVG
ncbi:hypothetical protein D3C73_790780 [compost metagenome]